MGEKLNAINVTTESRDELRRFQAAAAGVLGELLNSSQVLTLALRLASEHLGEDGPRIWEAMGRPTDRRRS